MARKDVTPCGCHPHREDVRHGYLVCIRWHFSVPQMPSSLSVSEVQTRMVSVVLMVVSVKEQREVQISDRKHLQHDLLFQGAP